MTTAHWLTPEKEPISENGIIPDIDYEKDIQDLLREDFETDIQTYMFERAITHLKEK